MAEILQHGQQLDLRTRRGADFGLKLRLQTKDATPLPIDISGAVVVSRIFAPGQADQVFGSIVDGPSGTITLLVAAGVTKNMVQDWQYVLAYKLAGTTTPLLFGAFRVAQDSL